MPQLATAADTAYQLQLPKVSFRVVEDDKLPAGVHGEQFRHFGYNDFSDFERPDFYIRYIEPIESELAKQVEYDMDEQDQEWLDAINAERKKEQSGPIPYEVFEIIMDKLEKEWFALGSVKGRDTVELIIQSKRIPQPASHMPVEDSKCAICDDGEGENSNAIVFCDGCNLAVHQDLKLTKVDCYGVPYIPEGQWLCRKCTVSPGNTVSCLFCPNEGGAFKQTNTAHWSHLLCAMWIPELGMGNAIYMEPVEGVELIPKSRWKLVCSLCRERVGACIQCDNRTCFTAFHVTCARQMGYLTSMKSFQEQDGPLRAFCEKHLPDEFRKEDVLAMSDPESDYSPSTASSPHKRHAKHPPSGLGSGSGPLIKKARGGNAFKKAQNAPIPLVMPTSVTTKTARAHAKSYRPGPPIVPNIIVQSVIDYVAKIAIRKRVGLVERVCRYWSLKREARRGAPLLKRLHLEPWTANSDPKEQTDAEKQLKLQFIAMLRSDLEKVRMLAEQVRKREKKKLAQAQVIKDVVDGFLFRGDGRLRLMLEKISAMDRQELFLNPVNRKDVPDYYNVIKEPMCWMAIDEKIDKNAYTSVAEFKRDVSLVLSNAMAYNGPDSPFHRAAKRIQTNAQPLLDELDDLSAGSDLLPIPTSDSPVDQYDLRKQQGLVGDLEASLLHLQSLIQPPLDMRTGTKDVLESLFKFELEPPKEPTPPPPPPPSPPKRVKVNHKAKWEEREAKHREHMALREAAGMRTGRTGAAADSNATGDGAGIGEAGPGAKVEMQAASTTEEGSRRRRRRKSNAQIALELAQANATAPEANTNAEAGPSRQAVIDEQALNAARRQRGVVGLEAVPIITDRERRLQEKAMDIVTETVDGLDQFKRFNVGWVLPEGSKRSRASEVARVDTPSASSRKGKARATTLDADEPSSSVTPLTSTMTHSLPSANTSGSSRRRSAAASAVPETSATNVVDTAAPAKRPRGRPKKIRPAPTTIADTPLDAPSSPLSSALSEASLTPEAESEVGDAHEVGPVEVDVSVTLGKKRKIAETGIASSEQAEDAGGVPDENEPERKTPKITLKRGQGGRFARQDAKGKEGVVGKTTGQDGRGSVAPPEQPVQPVQGASSRSRRSTVAQKVLGFDDGEDITPMASDEDDVVDQGDAADTSPSRIKSKEGGRTSLGTAAVGTEGEEADPFPPNTLVWARQTSFPYFPAEVIDHTDEAEKIPGDVWEIQPQGTEERTWLVRFFDSQASYAWVAKKRLDLLGEDDTLDQMYLSGKERGRSGMFKSPSMKRAVRDGYRDALAMMAGTDEE